ncbi:uncharacterized protein LOC135491652 [Lineus longissimus]|uniref:uncharacterized protein LOC135491652 n=1 Tax=Lineus longissimus TaxID=88925 RepID=UPI002B4F2621
MVVGNPKADKFNVNNMSQAITRPSNWKAGKRKNRSIKFLSELPFSVRYRISKSMDLGASPGYARLAGCLGYSQLDIAKFALVFKRMDGSPMMALFDDWESRNPTMASVLKNFKLAERFLEMEILKEFVPEKYHGEFANNSDDIDVDAMFDDDEEEDGAGAAEGIDVKPEVNGDDSKKSPENWKGRPGMPRENSWDEDGSDHPNGKRKISAESDGSLINANLKVGETKLSPTAPPLEDPDKTKNLSLDTRKDSISMAQSLNSLKKCTGPPMPSGSANIDEPCPQDQEQSLKKKNGKKSTNGSKNHQEAFEKCAFATVYSFLYEELKRATRNWSEDLKLGEGAFGTVYKVTNLRNTSTTFAVKQMKPSGAVGISEKSTEEFEHFKTEIIESRKYIHKNLIQISGYAIGPEVCIVYEYMSKGSLMDNLKCKGDLKPLLWKHRISILRGAARGLNYLHVMDAKHPLIHGDIKSENILLDQHFEPKISDLGLAKHALRANEMGEYTHVTLDNTYMHRNSAYLPKSFVQHPTIKRLSIKTDVHCFGVVIMNTLTGLEARTGKPFSDSKMLHLLVDIVHDCRDQAERLRLIDRKPSDTYPGELIDDMFQLAMKCTSDRKREQPCMKEVLEGIKEIEKRNIVIQGMKRQGFRPEKSAPPAVQQNPLDLELMHGHHIYRQQANMPTSRPDNSLQPQQSFQPGIPSLDAGPAAVGYTRNPSLHVQSLPARPQMGAAPNYQNSLRSDVSDSLDLYQSSASGMNQFQGVVGNNVLRTPLPAVDCSVPLHAKNCPKTSGKVKTGSHVLPGGKSSDDRVEQQFQGHPPDKRPDRLPPGCASLPITEPKPSSNGSSNYSLPPKFDEQVQQQFHRPPPQDNRQDGHQPNFRPTGSGSLPAMNQEKPAGSNPTNHSLPLNAMPTTQGQLPSVRDFQDEAARNRDQMIESYNREQEQAEIKRKKPLSLLSDVSDGSFPFPDVSESGQDSPGEQGLSFNEDGSKHTEERTSMDMDGMQQPSVLRNTGTTDQNLLQESTNFSGTEMNPEFQSLQLANPQDSDAFLQDSSQSLPPGLSPRPTFQINPPRACEESDERDGHISVSDEDMSLPARPGSLFPPSGGADMKGQSGENLLSHEFETITVSSLSDTGENESLTLPPAMYRAPPL